MNFGDVYLIDALRTPIGNIDGSLSQITATGLGVPLIREFIRRYPLVEEKTEHIILGNSVSAGVGQNPARQTALSGGVTPRANAFTVNQVCGSGMSVVGLSRSIMLDQHSPLIIAGAIESCSNMPFLVSKKDSRSGNSILVDSLYKDALHCGIETIPMGEVAEAYARDSRISREEQDDYAFATQVRAAEARRAGVFREEILPLETEPGKVLEQDEKIRENLRREALSRLRPVFARKGTVTPGNASGLGDGASLLLLAQKDFARRNGLKPMVRFVDTCSLGTPVESVFSGQAQVFWKLLQRNRLKAGDIDLFEVGESFACTVLGFLRETGVPPEKVNLWGGDIALGHPMGASGARLLVTLAHALIREGKRRGIAVMSMGGGHSIGVLLETVNENPLLSAAAKIIPAGWPLLPGFPGSSD